jgi:hypothetical protein
VIALSQDPQVDHQSEERLVAVFLFDSHKLKKYIEIAASGDRKGYATVLEAAFDKPLSDIEPLWHEYLQVVSKNIAVLEENPTSQFFLSKKDFDEFVKTNPTVFKDLDQHLSSKVTNGTTNSGANDVKKED